MSGDAVKGSGAPAGGLGLAVAAVVIGALLVGAGEWLARLGLDAVCDAELWGSSRARRRCALFLYPTARLGGVQIGALAMLLGTGWLWLRRQAAPRRARILSGLERLSLSAAACLAIGFATGEIALRLLFWDGASFGTHDGPLVRRFERDFVTNRYDGPSRGPEIDGPRRPESPRILIQGDSISWGQGVKPESEIYSVRLLERLRARNPRVEVAALAYGGREINGHLEQLQKWGDRIEPDAIVYQWFVNDIEIDKTGRPQSDPPWRQFFLHPLLHATSYFWFFLDDSLPKLVPPSRGYVEYIETDFAEGTANWRAFEEMFGRWAAEARRLTPRVLVMLYPRPRSPDRFQFPEVHERVVALARAHGLEALDLADAFEDYRGSYDRLWASPFDPHPSALAHARIAEALEERLLESWPELLSQRGPRPASAARSSAPTVAPLPRTY